MIVGGQAGGGSPYQVASNFNCLEVATADVDPESGSYVTNLMTDKTQGPAAAAGAGVAAITRTHAAFFSSDRGATQWGQTLQRQVELLGHGLLRPHFPVTNGKLFWSAAAAAATDDWPMPKGGDDTYWQPRLGAVVGVGLHAGVVANFTREPCRLVEAPPTIDQVFVAALNVHARGVKRMRRDVRWAGMGHDAHTLQTHATFWRWQVVMSKMLFLLRAAYRGTYAAAAMRRSTKLVMKKKCVCACGAQTAMPVVLPQVLTLVGGGSFGNPLPAVAAAMAEAHAYWTIRSCQHLAHVIVPLFDPAIDPEVFVAAFRAHGIDARVVWH